MAEQLGGRGDAAAADDLEEGDAGLLTMLAHRAKDGRCNVRCSSPSRRKASLRGGRAVKESVL
jgi:hypothetical protein